MKIGLICPTPEEDQFSGYLKRVSSHPFNIYSGRINKNKLSLIISGIGKTNAAIGATYLVEKFFPDLLILFGIAGAYPSSGLSVGDVAIAEKEFYGDEGVIIKDGFHGLDFINIPLLKKGKKRLFNEFPLNKGIVNLVKRKTKATLKAGNFVTLSTITGTAERAIKLRDKYNAICENMEGAAVAHVCEVFGKDLLEIRGISNIVDNRDRSRWDVKAGIKAYSNVLFDILNGLF
ncbi:MAG: futalosine hydrolase [Thermodesulfovibrionales bacterium]